MVKNTTEMVKVPASFLVDGFNDLPQETKDRIMKFSKDTANTKTDVENKELYASEVAAIVELLPDDMKRNLDNVGAVLPSDLIELSMRLGDFLYHLYAFNKKPTSQAPLLVKRHEKRLLELSEILDKDEIEVPSDVLNLAEEVMSDEQKWEKTQFGAMLSVKEQNRYIGLTAFGASIFRKIMNEATQMLV